MSDTLLELQARKEGCARRFTVGGCRWLTGLAIYGCGDDPARDKTGEEEGCLLVLSGTHDLGAGAGSWPARGVREEVWSGRPVALFLPPNTDWLAAGGRGEVLLVTARQPEVEQTESEAEPEKPARKPLLPLAGSNKAFDPQSKEWKPLESFPGSAEAILPRRIERVTAGAVTLERVFDGAYKALSLSVDEVVVPEGGVLEMARIPELPDLDEVLLYVRAEGEAEVAAGEDVRAVRGEAAFAARVQDIPGGLDVRAVKGRCYALLAYGGK